MATLLRGTTHLAARRQCYLPADLLLEVSRLCDLRDPSLLLPHFTERCRIVSWIVAA